MAHGGSAPWLWATLPGRGRSEQSHTPGPWQWALTGTKEGLQGTLRTEEAPAGLSCVLMAVPVSEAVPGPIAWQRGRALTSLLEFETLTCASTGDLDKFLIFSVPRFVTCRIGQDRAEVSREDVCREPTLMLTYSNTQELWGRDCTEQSRRQPAPAGPSRHRARHAPRAQQWWLLSMAT